MKCPFCNYPESKVLDSREKNEGLVIRRRRECPACKRRFTTYERREEIPLVVVKKDSRREIFDRSKLITGVLKACEKRPVSLEQVEQLADDIERDLRNRFIDEVPSRNIGQMVIKKLKKLDEVAYIRFASVYKEFGDAEMFIKEISTLKKR